MDLSDHASMARPSTDPLKSPSRMIEGNNTAEVTRFNGTINGLPYEPLILIFQCTVDIETVEMNHSFPSSPPRYVPITTPADRLASVCRYWRALVRDTASDSRYLWSVLWLDFRRPWGEIDRERDRILDLFGVKSWLSPMPVTARTPLDLFLSHLDSPFQPSSRSSYSRRDSSRSTSSRVAVKRMMLLIDASLHASHTLRSLSIHYSTTTTDNPLHLYGVLDLTNLRYFHFDWYPASLGLDQLIRKMPQLEVLKLKCREYTCGWGERRQTTFSTSLTFVGILGPGRDIISELYHLATKYAQYRILTT